MSFAETKSAALSERYQINVPYVVHETFADDEAAVINLKTGNYYSLNVSGAEVWNELAKNIEVRGIIEYLTGKYEGDSELMSRQVGIFIANLLREELITDFTGENEVDSETAEHQEIEEKTPFVAPMIEAYQDMQELLLLDPIHDVDETGFPNAKQ